MAIRKIVHIDESKCNGCGQCIVNCAEGALEIIDGKAKLVKDIYCDGLGACLGHCPLDAITVEEKESEEFDEKATHKYLSEKKIENQKKIVTMNPQMFQGGCPGSRMKQFDKKVEVKKEGKVTSTLKQWPVQLTLVQPNSPYFKGADLLITADCVPFAYGNYHIDFLKDKAVVVGCPKLDDTLKYTEKLEQIIKMNDLESITLLRMEVPCCGGMAMIAKNARDNSGINIPIKVVTIGIEGDIIKKDYI